MSIIFTLFGLFARILFSFFSSGVLLGNMISQQVNALGYAMQILWCRRGVGGGHSASSIVLLHVVVGVFHNCSWCSCCSSCSCCCCCWCRCRCGCGCGCCCCCCCCCSASNNTKGQNAKKQKTPKKTRKHTALPNIALLTNSFCPASFYLLIWFTQSFSMFFHVFPCLFACFFMAFLNRSWPLLFSSAVRPSKSASPASRKLFTSKFCTQRV